jgi:hypothetical protein
MRAWILPLSILACGCHLLLSHQAGDQGTRDRASAERSKDQLASDRLGDSAKDGPVDARRDRTDAPLDLPQAVDQPVDQPMVDSPPTQKEQGPKNDTLPMDGAPTKKDASAKDLVATKKDSLPKDLATKKDLAPKDAAPKPDLAKDAAPKPDLKKADLPRDLAPTVDRPRDLKPTGDKPRDLSCPCPSGPCCQNCTPKALYTPCTTSGGQPGQCNANGVCVECIPAGSQCGGGDPTPCCHPYNCDSAGGGSETCQ